MWKEEAVMQLKAEEKILESTKERNAAHLQEITQKLEMKQKNLRDKREETQKQLEAEQEALTKRQCEASLEEAAQQIEMEEGKLVNELDVIANCISSTQPIEEINNLPVELDVIADLFSGTDYLVSRSELEVASSSSAPTTSSSSNGEKPSPRQQCYVCEVKPILLVLPCAHMMLCETCSAAVKDSIVACFWCGSTVREMIFINRVY
jgi:Zinc finger, C3HC4 type (RING finger)